MSIDQASIENSNPASNATHKRLGSLQQFQARVADRIAQAQSGERQEESYLSLKVQNFYILFPLTQISELMPKQELTHLPLAKRWVLGLTVVRSEVMTVFDLGYCLNKLLQTDSLANSSVNKLNDNSRPSDPKMLVLNKSIGNQLAFFCDQLLGTVTLSQTELTLVEPDINDLDFPFAHALDSVYIKQFWRNTNGTIFIELSLLDLLKSPDFISITH